MEDVLDTVLPLVRLRACVYFVRDMTGPWTLDVPESAHGPVHLLLEGRAALRMGDRMVTLGPGDAVLFPRGGPHVLADAAHWSASGSAGFGHTRLLCGHFEWDRAADHPMFRELPEITVLRGLFGRTDHARTRSVIALIEAETGEPAPGGAMIADRLGEVLFVSLLRAWVESTAPETGLLASIRDPRLSRVLRHIHTNPRGGLDLSALSRIAGMSRTAFAVRFRQVLGVPPNAYLTDWRMLKARGLLVDTDLAIEDIVEQVGYGSVPAFSRAFKRRYGETPGRLRQVGLGS